MDQFYKFYSVIIRSLLFGYVLFFQNVDFGTGFNVSFYFEKMRLLLSVTIVVSFIHTPTLKTHHPLFLSLETFSKNLLDRPSSLYYTRSYSSYTSDY